MKSRLLDYAAGLLAICAGAAGAENLFTDGSGFETGLKGFQVLSYGLLGERGQYVEPYEIDGSTAAQGACSLKLNALNAGRFGLRSRVYTLEPGKKYTLSLYARADKPLALQFMLTSTGGGHSVGLDGRAALNGEWQRFSVSGILTEGREYPTYKRRYFFSIHFYDSPRATIWLDGLQLEEGDLTDYAAPGAGEINIEHPCRGGLFRMDEPPAPARLRATLAQPAETHRVQYACRDLYTDAVVDTGALDIPPGQTNLSLALPLPARPRGVYALEADLFRGARKISSCRYLHAFIRGVQPGAPLPPVQSFLGVHGDFGIVAAAWNPDRDFGYGMAPAGWFYEVLRDLGIQWQRIDSLSPQFLCRAEPGEIYGACVEPMAAFAMEYGVTIMPTIGHGSGRGPDWMVSDKVSVKTGGPLFNLAGYRQYLSKLVRAAPAIRYWETFNEPACYFSPEEFFELNKLSYEVIKAANPAATVIGICATSDLGGSLDLWTRRQVELGSLNYVDVVSVHEYYGHRTAAARDLIQLVAMNNKPYWDTETLFPAQSLYAEWPFMDVAPRAYGFRGWMNTPAEQAVRAVATFAESFALGVARQFIHAWLPQPIWYGASGSLFEHDLSARPIIPAIDAFNELIDGGEPRGMLDIGGANKCCIFEKNGIPIVFFQMESDQRVEIPLDASLVRVLDLMGNPAAVASARPGVLAVNAGPKPLYFIGAAGSGTAALTEAFKQTDLQTRVFSAALPRLGMVDGRPAIIIRVSNEGARAGLSGRIAAVSLPAGLAAASAELPFENIELRETREIPFFLETCAPADLNPCVFEITGNGKTQRVAADIRVLRSVRCGRPPVIDGAADEWPPTLPAIKLDRADELAWKVQGTPWVDARDCSARLVSQWDAENIYFLINVSDDRVMMDAPIREKVKENKNYLYLADCVELFFDAELMRDFAMPRHNADDYQVLVAPPLPDGSPMQLHIGAYTGHQSAQFDWQAAAEVTAAAVLTADGYRLEVRVPWQFLGGPPVAPGAMLGFDLAVDDDDTEDAVAPAYAAGTDLRHVGRDIQMKWGSVSSGDPTGYGVLMLE